MLKDIAHMEAKTSEGTPKRSWTSKGEAANIPVYVSLKKKAAGTPFYTEKAVGIHFFRATRV
jgi:hypothetical protein